MDLEVGFVDVPALARAASRAVTPLAQRLSPLAAITSDLATSLRIGSVTAELIRQVCK
jgi:hypothetical protein